MVSHVREVAEREEKLKELWKKGHSGSQIANILGNTKRNAVIGKAHRLNLQARAVSKKTDVNQNVMSCLSWGSSIG